MNSVLYMQQTGTMGHSAKAKRRREYVSLHVMVTVNNAMHFSPAYLK